MPKTQIQRSLLYAEGQDMIKKSGLGKAITHQARALELAQVPFTLDRNDSYDLLHINTYLPSSVIFAELCRKSDKAIVYHAHSTEEDFENSFIFSNQMAPFFKQWISYAYSLGDVLITPTPYSKKLLEGYGLTKEIFAISNGVDLDAFQPLPHAREKFLEKWGYSSRDFVVMGIGLFLKRKGILDFVELASRMGDIQFIWFGDLNLNLVPEEVRDAVKTSLPNLRFAGYVPREEINLALQGSDLYIFPTLEETEGIPAIEACAARADFIVRDIPVFDPWLKDGVHCYKAKDVDDFEEKIRLFQKKKLPSLKEAAYGIAQERNLTNIGKDLGKAYERAREIRDQRVAKSDRSIESLDQLLKKLVE